MYVIQRSDGTFSSREQAERERCIGNEIVVPVEAVLQRAQ
jgi:hypothetical protein